VQLHSDDWTQQLTQGQVLSSLGQQLHLLPKLPKLQLRTCQLTAEDITPLSSLQRLQHLHLDLSYGYEECEYDLEWALWGENVCVRELLAALQHLTQLQHLELFSCQLDAVKPGLEPGQPGEGGYQCFSALTASTQLTALIIETPWDTPVPEGAVTYMFPAGRVLPNFKVLHIANPLASCGTCVGEAQIAMIAASCPALQELKLQHVTPWRGFDVSCLEQLPPGVTSVEGLDWSRRRPAVQ
jgi:hypothetical protein